MGKGRLEVKIKYFYLVIIFINISISISINNQHQNLCKPGPACPAKYGLSHHPQSAGSNKTLKVSDYNDKHHHHHQYRSPSINLFEVKPGEGVTTTLRPGRTYYTSTLNIRSQLHHLSIIIITNINSNFNVIIIINKMFPKS